MLRKIYYLYQTNPETKFKEFGSIFEKTVQKPSKSTGTCWLAQKVRTMEIILTNYGIFMAHIKSLSQTLFAKKYPINLAMYMTLLTISRELMSFLGHDQTENFNQ